MKDSFIHYIVGDATDPISAGNRIIAHVCNDIGAWGAGFVLEISKRWPEACRAYTHEKQSCALKLGTVGLVKVEKTIWVANMVAQHGIRSRNSVPPIRYDALRKCLAVLAEHVWALNATVHMPRIGCGLAGGRWDQVEPIIRDQLAGLTVFVYDLPRKGAS